MDTLSKPEIETLKQTLLQKQSSLLRQRQHLVEQDPFADMQRANENAALDTEAEEQEGHARLEAIETEVDASLAMVNKALEKIEANSFGICTICGNAIEKARLTLDPAIDHCLACHKQNQPHVGS